MGILFNSTALGIHFCETSLIFNFKTRLGGEICLCDVNMHKGYCSRSTAWLLRRHENRTGYGFFSHTRTVISARFLSQSEAATRAHFARSGIRSVAEVNNL